VKLDCANTPHTNLLPAVNAERHVTCVCMLIRDRVALHDLFNRANVLRF